MGKAVAVEDGMGWGRSSEMAGRIGGWIDVILVISGKKQYNAAFALAWNSARIGPTPRPPASTARTTTTLRNWYLKSKHWEERDTSRLQNKCVGQLSTSKAECL